ncbi:hypothetical protein FBEOM_7691 [Fusarium beomiforme]|uniref:F-box domain-containing protein n=1 Tax=Fusarium beomiforme TaxID=44412 RepID=A0A9P5AIB3_9HYPO|nr:hypothetical protein FBEOM_7691 [Fusarium beomiforme]
MPQLLDFPNEILTQICTTICDSDRLALFKVIHVNKRLHRIASPLLVRHWPFHPWILHKKAPALFALHLIRNPHLQRNVKSITFDELLPIADDDPWANFGELDELAISARQSFPDLANDASWCEGLLNGLIDPIATLLLALCTRIEKLDLNVPFYQESAGMLVQKLVSLALKHHGPERPLENLQVVVLRWYDVDDPGNIQCAAPFFHLPNVKILGLEAFSDEILLKSTTDEIDPNDTTRLRLDPAIYETRFPVETSPIEELILESACLTSHGLFTIVRACKRLRKLVCTCSSPVRLSSHDIASGDLTRQALLHHAASLEELTLSLESHRFWENDGTLHLGRMGGLTCFKDCFKQLKNLKRLIIDIHLLHFHDTSPDERMIDCLPTSLEYLGLQCNLASYPPQVAGYVNTLCTLLEVCGHESRLEALKTLDAWLCVYQIKGMELFEPVSKLAEEKGVQFTFTPGHYAGEGNSWSTMGIIPDPHPPIVGPKTVPKK